MQAELERTAEEEAEYRAKQKEKAQARCDDLTRTFAVPPADKSATSSSSNEVDSDAAAADNVKPAQPKTKAAAKPAAGKVGRK